MPTKSLFLQVDGNIDPLRAAMKAGKSVMAEFGGAAEDVAAEVQKAFEKLGGGNIEVNAQRMEASIGATFQKIRANAEAAANSGNGADVLKILGLADAEQAVSAAEAQVAAFRMLADGAHQAAAAKAQDATATESEIAAARALAVALEADFVAARANVGTLRTQAGALGGVRDQLGIAADGVQNLHEKNGMARIGQMELTHAVRSTTDMLVMGQSPLVAISLEMGRFVQGIGYMTGGAGKFAAFMQGPYGMGVMAAVTALSLLIGTQTGAAESADKQKDAENDLANVIKRVTDETKNLNDNELVTIQRHIDAARAAIARAQAEKRLTAAILEQALASQKKVEGAEFKPDSPEGGWSAMMGAAGADKEAARALLAAAVKRKEISQGDADKLIGMANSAADLKKKLDEVNKDIEKGGRALEESLIKLGTTLGTARSDRSATRNLQFSQDQIRLDQQARREKWSVEQTAAATQKLTEARDADLKKIREEEKTHRARKHSDRGAEADATNVAYMQRFLKEALPGVRITSTTGGKHVDGSDHYKGRALDFVPAGGMGSMTKADVRELFESNGIEIRRNKNGVEQLFGPGDKGHSNHFHVAWEGAAPKPGTLAKRANAAELHDLNDDRAYEAELSQAQSRYAHALLSLADTAEGRYEIEVQALRDTQDARVREINDKLKAGKYGKPDSEEAKARARRLLSYNDETEFLEEVKRKSQERQAILDEQLAHDRAELGDQISMLHLEDDLATTRKARLRIALELLAAEEKGARAAANRDLKSDKQEVRAQGQKALDKLDREHPLKVAAINQRNADPVTAYLQQIKANAGDMNEALKGVEADGLKNLEDGLVGIVSGTESVASAFKKMAASIIADLARIAIEKAILGSLGKIFGHSAGGGGGDWSSFDMDALDSPGFAAGRIPGFADGGTRIGNMIRGPGTGTSDSILALLGTNQPIFVSNGESIVTAEATRRNAPWLEAMNKGLKLPAFAEGRVPTVPSLPPAASLYRPASPAPRPYFDLRGAVMTQDLLDQINRMGETAATAGASVGSADAIATIGRRQARRLPTMSLG